MFSQKSRALARLLSAPCALALVPTGGLIIASPAVAQGIGQTQESEVILVTASREGTPTAPSIKEARERLERIPGGIGFVEDRVFEDQLALTIGDALQLTPGVFADTSALRESRISIRGSGISSGFERRGLTVVRDGVPISRANGSTEFQEVDPLSIRYLEVFKGANGLRFGGASLGGAVNIVSPTGRTARSPVALRLEGGDFNTLRGNAALAGVSGDVDYWVGVTGLTTDGFRENSAVNSLYGHANLGWRVSDRVETRFYLTALSDNFELAGTLRLQDALENPRAAGRPVQIGPFFPGGPVTVLDPGPVADGWDRNLDVLRFSNLTSVDLGATRLDVGAWYSNRKLDHAITRFAGVIVQDEDEFGVFTHLAGDLGELKEGSRWMLGASFATASNFAQTFANNSGERGALRTQADQDSTMLLAYGELDVALTKGLNALVGGQFTRAVRDVTARLNTVSGRAAYQQFNPRFGLIGQVAENAQVYGNISRSFEPPSLADLTAGGAMPFDPLDPQRATTFEIGTRGQSGALAWDISLYRSEIENEFIRIAINNGANAITANADKTLHQGIEAGLDLYIARGALEARGQSLRLSTAYTFSDFRFQRDALYGDNQLPGLPRHLIVSELRFDQRDAFYLAVNLRWAPEGMFADFANTEKAPGYEVVQLTGGVDLTRSVRLFGIIENLFDTRYIANVGTNPNQSIANAALYTPGQIRAGYVGLSARF